MISNDQRRFLLVLHQLTDSPTAHLYDGLLPQEGLKISTRLICLAQEGMDNAKTDYDYWGFNVEMAFARMVQTFFKTQIKGLSKIPSLPDPNQFKHKTNESKITSLENWVKEVESLLAKQR